MHRLRSQATHPAQRREESAKMALTLQYSMTVFVGAMLIVQAAGFPRGARDAVNMHTAQRLKRQSSDDGVQSLIAGFTYTKLMLLSCREPTILPDVSGINKTNCSPRPGINSAYTSLIAALDKVLRLYAFQKKFLDGDRQNMSVEMRALQIVMDTLVNQTCTWIESLGVRYSGNSDEPFTCSQAQIMKLHALISSYQLVEDAQRSTFLYVNKRTTQRQMTWLANSGARPALAALFNGTDYGDVHLSFQCTSCSHRS